MRWGCRSVIALWAVCLAPVVCSVSPLEAASGEPAQTPEGINAQIETLMNLGMAYGETGRWVPAIERFKQALALDPQFAPAHYGLGRVYFEMKQYPESETELLAAVQIVPRYIDAHFILSFVKEQLGNTRGAIEHAERALEAIDARKEWAKEEVRAGRLEQDDRKLAERLQRRLSKLRNAGEAPKLTP